MKLAVLGAGAWGTALAIALCQRHAVSLWARDTAHLSAMNAARANQRYLPGNQFPGALALSGDMTACVQACDLILVAVPAAALRGVLREVRASAKPVVWLCKGFETNSSKLPHQIAQEELPADVFCGALSGPSFAQEIARGLPAAVTLAGRDAQRTQSIAFELHSPRLRVYSSDDPVGVEIAGAVKNVIAIAAGICDGLGLGLSARAALITRGLAELMRLGLKLGGRRETFMGLAGAGDLILTCTGELSRNRRVGLMLARGIPLKTALSELGHVAEGVYTAPEVDRLAQRHDIDMPITAKICQVLFQGLAPAEAVAELLDREPKAEF